MAFIGLEEINRELEAIREKGELNPISLGFRSWRDYESSQFLQFSRGDYVLIGGEPHHGKTYFTNEIIMQLMEKHAFKVALFSNETGNAAKIFSMFCGLYIGKPFSKCRPDGKENYYAMSDQEKEKAYAYLVDKLFVWKQTNRRDKKTMLENIYNEVNNTEAAYGIKFDSLVIDPIYDIDDFEPKADVVRQMLATIDEGCKESNRVDIVVNHVSETPKILDKNTGKRYKTRALADEFYGGKNNNRKAKLQILVERPTPNLDPEDPADYVPENQTNVYVLKAKPEGVAKMGVYPLYYDWKSRRYKEYHEGQYLYSDSIHFEYEPENEGLKKEDLKPLEPKEAFSSSLPF